MNSINQGSSIFTASDACSSIRELARRYERFHATLSSRVPEREHIQLTVKPTRKTFGGVRLFATSGVFYHIESRFLVPQEGDDVVYVDFPARNVRVKIKPDGNKDVTPIISNRPSYADRVQGFQALAHLHLTQYLDFLAKVLVI